MKLLILENVHTGKKRQYKRGWTPLKVGDSLLLDNQLYKVLKVIDKPKKKEKKTLLKNYSEIGEEIRKEAKEKKALSEFRNRPYFKTIVTEVKGKPQGEENRKRIKYPFFL